MPLSPASGPGGGGSFDGGTITTPLTILADISGPGSPDELLVQTAPAGSGLLRHTLNSDGAGNADSFLAAAGRGSGTAGMGGSDDTRDGWFQWYTQYGWEYQPRSTAADADVTFLLHTKTGGKQIEAHAVGTLGFYGVTPVAQQTGVAVTAAAIHAALVALGLITA